MFYLNKLDRLKNSKLLHNAGIYGLANVAVAGVPFLMLPVLTRYLDNESYGMIGMFSLCVSIFSILVGFSSHGSLLVRYGNYGKTGMVSYISSMLLVLLFGTLTLLVLTVSFSDYLSELVKVPSTWININTSLGNITSFNKKILYIALSMILGLILGLIFVTVPKIIKFEK